MSNELPTITTTTTNESSRDKLSEIKNDLKQIFTQPRRPTESPFFSKTIISTGNKPMPIGTHVNDDLPTNVPSTAEVECMNH